MAKVAEYKKKLVEDMVKLMRQSSMIGVVDMNNLPAPQLQSMRSELRGKINLFMTKKRLMRIALDKIKNEKKGIEELEKYLQGMPALILANESPFKLSRTLQKSKTSAPAKAGQIAPNDILINKGPTPFAPGPIISELSSVGLKVGVEGGKVAVKEDSVIAKKGEKIKPKVAEILTRLDIRPMEVGLGLVAAYEDGIIYQKDILEIDEKAFNEKINLAATQALNLSFNITYVTKNNIDLLMSKAFNDAKAIGISQKILDKGIIEQLLNKAEMEMLGLKNSANIETKAQETKEEVKPAEQKPEKEKLLEVKKEVKKDKAEQKEEKALEEEKEILKEEQKLEEKPKQEQAPVEKEVQEAVKEEEEKQLEQERIEKEKQVEKAEKEKEPSPEEDVDKKVKLMVEKTKKFAEGKEETAADILKEVKKEEKKEKEEEKIQQQEKEEHKEQVTTTHDLKKQKEDKEKAGTKEDKDRKEVEELTKELLKKGTLRKK